MLSEVDKVKVLALLGAYSLLLKYILFLTCAVLPEDKVLVCRPTLLPDDFREQLFSEHKSNIIK